MFASTLTAASYRLLIPASLARKHASAILNHSCNTNGDCDDGCDGKSTLGLNGPAYLKVTDDCRRR